MPLGEPSQNTTAPVLDQGFVDDAAHRFERAVGVEEHPLVVAEFAPLLALAAVGLRTPAITSLLGSKGHSTTLTLARHDESLSIPHHRRPPIVVDEVPEWRRSVFRLIETSWLVNFEIAILIYNDDQSSCRP